MSLPKYFKKAVLLLLLLSLIGVYSTNTSAESDPQKLEELNKQIQEYTQKIDELQSTASTLSNQIAQYDANIRLTQLRIDQAQEKILLLGGRIDQLGSSLENLNTAFETRVKETYKIARIGENPLMWATSGDVNETLSRYYYLQKIQQADQSLLTKLQDAQDTYIEQKDSLVLLEEELSDQQQVLGAQKTAKANLLSVTKNDEKKFQELLSEAREEYEAIQAIIAGRGEETEIGHVNEGQRIASVIQGASCNSSGAHVHFIVKQGTSTQNPFNYLKPVDHQNCSGPGECSPGDTFNPSGSWEWPINPPIRYAQGYGSTWAIQNTYIGRIYSFHNGIDINNRTSSTVKAVKPGTLYQGSFSGVGGCKLRYVRVDHDENDIETFYLHINY